MRLSVEHRTTYRFTVPQSRLTQLLRLTPEDTFEQTVIDWDIHVDCDARMRHSRDGFGNKVTMLYVEGPISGIEIAVAGEVLTSDAGGIVHGTSEPLPPALFLRATPLTRSCPALDDFARDAISGESDPIARLHALNIALGQRFTADRRRPVAGRSAADAFDEPAATPRDLAHMFIAGARAVGAPARYISGYTVRAPGGAHRPTPHGWAEAFVEGLGWIGFDPCAGICADEAYVRVAVALDAAGAAPVAGSRLGEGDECMDVDVLVARSDEQ